MSPMKVLIDLFGGDPVNLHGSMIVNAEGLARLVIDALAEAGYGPKAGRNGCDGAPSNFGALFVWGDDSIRHSVIVGWRQSDQTRYREATAR